MAKGEIAVHGERYASVDDLVEAIAGLEIKLEDMPSESPEAESLRAHIERLREAAEGGDSVPLETLHPVGTSAESPPETADDDEEEVQTTTSLQEAAEQGSLLLCPCCGQEVPFPDTPPVDATVTQCPNCQGWGKVVRPTRVDGQVWHDCPRCNGNGYVDSVVEPSFKPTQNAAQVAEAPGALWDVDRQHWNPPPGAQPPWVGATWDHFYGKWS